MNKIKLPIDTKSLYFNIRNDNSSGHTSTVASPLKKKVGDNSLDNILLLKNKEVDISQKNDLLFLLIQHSKTKVLIKNLFIFNRISVNGLLINNDCSFGCYIKEEIDESKVQFGRLKLHYPSKLIYEDNDLNINNKKIYKLISEKLNNYAFIVRAFEYDFSTDILNFDALIVGENNIPYSKVFINEKGVGNKFNLIFNENADDYDREIIALRKQFGDTVNPYNFMEYANKMKRIGFEIIKKDVNAYAELVSDEYPYSLFDFCFDYNNIKKYGILMTTATKNFYFNLSMIRQNFILNNIDNCFIYVITDIFNKPELKKYCYDDLSSLNMSINSIKYEGESQ